MTGIYPLNRQSIKLIDPKKIALYEDRISKGAPTQYDGYPRLTQKKTTMLDEIDDDIDIFF